MVERREDLRSRGESARVAHIAASASGSTQRHSASSGVRRAYTRHPPSTNLSGNIIRTKRARERHSPDSICGWDRPRAKGAQMFDCRMSIDFN